MARMLPSSFYFKAVIDSFIRRNDAAGCEAFINGIMRGCGRPRIRGHRSDEAEMKVAMFLFEAHVRIAEDALEQAKWGKLPKLEGINKLYYTELCKWNGVEHLPNYYLPFSRALEKFPSMNLTYKSK